MSKHQHPKPLRSAYPEALVIAATFTLIVLVGIPLTQMLSDKFIPMDPGIKDPPALTPPTMVQPDPVIEETDPEEPIEEFEDKPVYPTLTDLEFNNAPNIKGFYPTNVAGIIPQVDESQLIHSIGDLTSAPRPVQQVQPVYPPDMKAAGLSGNVWLEFVVDADGTTRQIKVVDSSNPSFEEPARRAIRKWLFQPGEKDGKAVHCRVRMQMPFRFN